MPLQTTAIGAFPKPSYVELPDWFAGDSTAGSDATVATTNLVVTEQLESEVARGVHDVVRLQLAAGVDIPTDGEVARENYVHYHCRHLDGIDFNTLTEKVVRDGTWTAQLPTFVGPVAPRSHFLDADYRIAQAASERPVKMTMPGPLTIMDSTADDYYGSELTWGHALAEALNHEVGALVLAGCTQIQIDEPVFARYPQAARSYGFDLLEIALHGVPPCVTTTLHMCCGYPDRLDNPDYPKADPESYVELADLVDRSSIDAVSLEDAHRPNPLQLFERFERTTVVLGSVQIASSRIEPEDEIATRVETVLRVLPASRLVLAPDCGLGMLSPDVAVAKLRNIRRAADRF
ncbi:MAG TPA: cobalamin-independent methionine synthase II family protein [Acidimicrobiia bacterium]|nr:cobalamin-independent methionine synthase II family protein [Acidimicrobiia bacterium]